MAATLSGNGLLEAVGHHQASRLDEAERGYRSILAGNRDHPDALHLLSLIERTRGRFADAFDLMTKARALAPELPGLVTNASILVETAQRAAAALEGEGRLDEAAALLERVVAFDTVREAAWTALGTLSLRRGDYATAERAWRRLTALDPGNGEAWRQLVLVLLRTGRLSEAVAAGCQIVAGLPSQTESLRFLATATLFQGPVYQELLHGLHQRLHPRTYVEIGVFQGSTLTLAGPRTRVIGIDPNPRITARLPPDTVVHAMTSDAFFAAAERTRELAERSFELAFIDGFHSFDQALRDFIHLERFAGSRSVIAIHDCYPTDSACAERIAPGGTAAARLWAGDVWKVIPALRAYRPDLTVRTVPTRPTGLAIVTGLDRHSTVLAECFEQIVARYLPLSFEFLRGREAETLNVIANDWPAIEALLPVGA